MFSSNLCLKKSLDINECHLERHNCDTRASCVNTHGAFYCECSSGFEFNQRTNQCEGIFRAIKLN
jgi:hypothetical protein